MQADIQVIKATILRQFDNNQTAVARVVGVTPQAVSEFIRKGKHVPAKWCIPLETAAEGKITRHDLRPDLYPVEGKA